MVIKQMTLQEFEALSPLNMRMVSHICRHEPWFVELMREAKQRTDEYIAKHGTGGISADYYLLDECVSCEIEDMEASVRRLRTATL